MHSPIVTANIYCDRRLDAVVHEVVVPWLEMLRGGGEGDWGIWWVRYTRNGEHLKVRLHGPEAEAERAKELLEEATGRFFATLPPVDPTEERRDRPRAPAIDAEDESPEIRPDRTLLWTRFRRSPVSLGPLFLEDDEFVGRLMGCLAHGAELVMAARPDARGVVPEGVRQRTLITAVIAGLGGAPFADRAAYLEYHRDWLLRFTAADAAREARLRESFDARLAGMAALVEQLGRTMDAEWSAAAEGPGAPLRAGIAGLCARAEGLGLTLETLGDPYAGHAAYPLLFKSLQGIANQAGVDMTTEAFVHHLLAAAARGAATPACGAGA
jgi:hypothetical protein